VDDIDAEPRHWTPARLLARLYDWEHDAFTADLDLYTSLAQRTGGPVLEPTCGTGRLLEPLARRGLQVVGFDSSPEMLERARARLDGLGSRAILSQADLRDALPVGPFHMVILTLDALGLLEETATQIDLLSRIREGMAEQGVLVLDLVHAPPLWDQPQGVPVLQHSGADGEIGARVTKWVVQRILPARQQIRLECFYDLIWSDGSLTRLEESVGLRFFARYELELMLSAAGLRVENIYGDYELQAFSDESPRMIVFATRGS
jgi:SAM-dependent methyltransferase